MADRAFSRAVGLTPTRFPNPPWRAVLSDKGLLAHLRAMAPGHPNLPPTDFEGDPAEAGATPWSAAGSSAMRPPACAGARARAASPPIGRDSFPI